MKKLFLLCVAALLTSSAQATPISYFAILTGPGENPANASPGTGNAMVTYDPAVHTLAVDVTFAHLEAGTTASHIHCCTIAPGTAMVATTLPTFPLFPLGVTSGSYMMTFDLTLAGSWNPAFVTAHGGTTIGAETALALGLASGTSYLNIHTTQFPGGEIRGFLTAVPEPSTLILLAIPMLGLLFMRRSRR